MDYYFSKNIVSYCFLQKNKLFGLILSVRKGWGIINFPKSFFLIKEKELHFFLSYNKTYLIFLSNVFLGFQRGYFIFLKLKGIGYKYMWVKQDLILKFGVSHRIIFINYLNLYCKFINKYALFYMTRSFGLLKNLVQSFKKIRKENNYKKKGIFLKGSLITLKVSSKKSKF